MTGNNSTILRSGLISGINIREAGKTPKKMEVYPNPATDMIYFKSNSNEVVQFINVFDLQGRLLLIQNSIIKPEINVSNLPKGIYFLEIKTDKNIYQGKIIKE